MSATPSRAHPALPSATRASLYRRAAAAAATEAWDTTSLVATLRVAADRADAEPTPDKTSPRRIAAVALPAAYGTWPI